MGLSAFMVETVSDGTLSLGTFLSTINVFKEIGTEISEIYLECMEIQLSFGPLKKITRYMNYETDLVRRMEIGRNRQEEGKHAREEARAKMTEKQKAEGALAVDAVEIQVKDLSFSYKDSNENHPRMVLENINVSFAQGKLFAFVGPPREGKATFLKLLGQSIYTQAGCGDIFVPPHLRVLHVSREATILRKTFLDNILMGAKLADVGGMERVLLICQRLQFGINFINMLARDTSQKSTDCTWAASLSHTDQSRLNLARVLVGNPEVLIMHKPVASFDDRERENITELLREHVDEKGIGISESKLARRPRTLFFTCTSAIGVKKADTVYKVSMKDGIIPIAKESVTNGLLM
jgi:ABC-type multidrug transport system fused ATPase/permease subunit